MKRKTIIIIAGILSAALAACASPKAGPETAGSSAAPVESSVTESESAENEESTAVESLIASLPTEVVEAGEGASGTSAPEQAESRGDFDQHKDYANLTEDSREALTHLDTDYNKVYWGVEYSVPGTEGVVISVTPLFTEDTKQLILGFTNLYGADITINAEGTAKNEDGESVANIYVYESGVGNGQTVLANAYCDGTPDGRIHWDKFEVKESKYDKFAYWESDWALTADSAGYFNIPYKIAGAEEMQGRSVWALLLDKNGFVCGYYEDYIADKGMTLEGVINTYTEASDDVGDVAFFANPKKAS